MLTLDIANNFILTLAKFLLTNPKLFDGDTSLQAPGWGLSLEHPLLEVRQIFTAESFFNARNLTSKGKADDDRKNRKTKNVAASFLPTAYWILVRGIEKQMLGAEHRLNFIETLRRMFINAVLKIQALEIKICKSLSAVENSEKEVSERSFHREFCMIHFYLTHFGAEFLVFFTFVLLLDPTTTISTAL